MITIMEEKKIETPLDIAIEIQQALSALTYRVLAFSEEKESRQYIVRVQKVGVYCDSLAKAE
jgi:hypothetical protein